jgi:hypothetical protein
MAVIDAGSVTSGTRMAKPWAESSQIVLGEKGGRIEAEHAGAADRGERPARGQML